MNFYEQSNRVGFCKGSSCLASLLKSNICYLLGNEMNVLFMFAMGLGFLGLGLFFFFPSCLNLILLGGEGWLLFVCLGGGVVEVFCLVGLGFLGGLCVVCCFCCCWVF